MKYYDIYDIETKQKISIENIEPYKIYLYIEDNYCSTARLVGFDENKNMIKQTYISYEEQLRVAVDLIKAKYKNLGVANLEVKPNSIATVCGMKLEMPHISVKYDNLDGKEVEEILNENTLEKMVEIDETGKISININHLNIGDNGIESKEDIREKVSRQAENKEDRTENDNISANRSKGPNRGQSKVLNNFSNSNPNSKVTINFINNDITNMDISSFAQISENPNCKISLNQFGFARNYDFEKPEDVEQFKKDLEIMPKSRNENMHEQSREDSRGN